MLRRLTTSGLLLMLVMVTPPLEAQEATPTHVVMRYFKCNPQGAAVAMFQEGRAVAQEMVEEGKFISYGILTHNWGDEWNVVDFFAIDGLDDYFANFAELLQRVNAAAQAEEGEDDAPSFSEVCTEHKDNIYSVVPPPSGN